MNTAKSVRPLLIFSVLFQLMQAGLILAYVFLSKTLVDLATGEIAGSDITEKLIICASALILCIIVRICTQAAVSYMESKAEISIANSLRFREFNNILRLQSDFRAKYHSGDMVNRLQTDVSAIASCTGRYIPNVIGAGLKFCIALGYLITLQPALALILVIVLPLGLVAGKFILRSIRKLSLEVRESDSEVQSHVQESLQHLPIIRSLEYGAISSSELGHMQRNFYGKVMRRTRFSLIARIITGLGFSLAYAIAFLWGVRGIYLGVISYGMMTAFLQLVGQIQHPLLEISEQLPSIFHCTASIDRLNEIESLPKEPDTESIMLKAPCGIRAKNLEFSYPDSSHKVFDNFSYDFKPGSRTAIVGETGVGKSTLIKLFLSLLKPDNGSIEIYNQEGESLESSASGRCNFIYVPQGNSLFSGTIRENLKMGKADASEEEMKEALRISAADFVFELEKGLDTECFEAGGGLSEGQAQRIAIARALLRPGSIMLLDEFSSALDPETENILLERLCSPGNDRDNKQGNNQDNNQGNDNSRINKTMIFITHRERVGDFCDNFLKL